MPVDTGLVEQLKEQGRQELADSASKKPFSLSKMLLGAGGAGALAGGAIGGAVGGGLGIPVGAALGLTAGIVGSVRADHSHGTEIATAKALLATTKRKREAELHRQAMEEYLKTVGAETPEGITVQE